MRFGEEQQLEKTGAENAGEPEVMCRTTEVRTGRGNAGLVRGEMRGVERTGPGKVKERVTEERVNMKAKEELEAKEDSRSRTQ